MRLRPVTLSDRAFVQGLAARLVGFGLPLERDPRPVQINMERELGRIPDPSPEVFERVAEDRLGVPLGFVQAAREYDEFSFCSRAYVHVLAVTEAAEGHGVGRFLLEAVQGWSLERGWNGVALHVFASNARARGFYHELGYLEDSIRLVRSSVPTPEVPPEDSP